MNITGQYLRRLTNENGDVELTFVVNNYQSKIALKELKKGDTYRMSLAEVKSNRSINQNNLMWQLLEEIAEKTKNEVWDLYLLALERADAKYEYIASLPECEPLLRSQFRAIKLMNSFEHNGKTFNQYKVYYGSSTLNTKEMNKLIDVVKDMAVEEGIDYDPFI